MSKYVFITGGTKGIGKAVAECLAKSGEVWNFCFCYSG